jgi:hypothetical protein
MKTYLDNDKSVVALADYIENAEEGSRAASWVATRLRQAIDRRKMVLSKIKREKLTWPPPEAHSCDHLWKSKEMLQESLNELVQDMNSETPAPGNLTMYLAEGLKSVAWDVTVEVTGLYPSGDDPVFENELYSSFNALASELIEWINEQRLKDPKVDVKA